MGDGEASPQPMFQPQETRSLRDGAYDAIRDAILAGALRPGERIKERDIAAQMDISTTPVKEALRRLEQEGLIISQPRRGAVVGPLALTPESEILELRADLEGLAARFAATSMSNKEKEALKRQLLEVERPVQGDDEDEQERMVECILEFHRQVHLGSQNPFIVRFLQALAPFDRTIRRRAMLDSSEWARDSREHRAICDAILRGDADAAEKAMHDHVHRVVPLAQSLTDPTSSFATATPQRTGPRRTADPDS